MLKDPLSPGRSLDVLFYILQSQYVCTRPKYQRPLVQGFYLSLSHHSDWMENRVVKGVIMTEPTLEAVIGAR
jgi:hypothetical protein